MTILFSIASPDFIVMTADSAVTITRTSENDIESVTEYDTGRKSYIVEGVGCVTTWGERNNNTIGRYLEQQNWPAGFSVEDLAAKVYQFLTEIYRPHELPLGDVGYHVAGFDSHSKPRLYHILWGYARPRNPEQTEPRYMYLDHSPSVGLTFLYNGRNDLAETLVHTLLYQIQHRQAIKFDFTTHQDMVRFADFLVRFGAEITPQVGPPFFHILISRNNHIERLKNDYFCPVSNEEIEKALSKLL